MDLEFSTESLAGYDTDEHAETEGVRVQLNDKVFFRIRRAGGRNHAYNRAIQKGYRAHRRMIDNGLMGEDALDEKIFRPAFVNHVVVGWEGVEDAEGEALPYSKERCAAFFDRVPEAYQTLRRIADDLATFLAETRQETAERLGEY